MSYPGKEQVLSNENFQPDDGCAWFISAEQGTAVNSNEPLSDVGSTSGVGFPTDKQPIIQDSDNDEETENLFFSDKTIRRGFIRKVYAILMCQLMVTTCFIATFVYVEEVQRFVEENDIFFPITFVTMLVMLVLISCCTELRRKTPVNYILLAVFTVTESLLLGCIAMKYDSFAVLTATGVCAAVCLGLTVFALQTKWDFTVLGGSLFSVLLILIIFGIIAICIPSKGMLLLYSSLGVILFSLYLVYDTQLMLGGKHKYSVSPEEYIFAALNLYVDVINIFLHLLSLTGRK